MMETFVDLLLMTPFPVAMRAVVRPTTLGLLKMEDEAGIDLKIQQFPSLKCYPLYKRLNEVHNINLDLLAQINHLFFYYKDLEAGKTVFVTGWSNKKQAENEFERSYQRYLDYLDG